MERITLSETRIRKLQKESHGIRTVFNQLCRESMARDWLRTNGIPSWRNPSTPPENSDNRTAENSRYSILFSDGSRFLVCSYPETILSLDILAKAKCFAALAVNLDEGGKYGFVMGCIFLRDISYKRVNYDFNTGGLESNSAFLQYLGRHKRYKAEFIGFSIRLLLSGEPDAPGWGTDGVHRFTPGVTGGYGEHEY